MKKFIKNSIFTILFAFAFMICGAVGVSAASALNNTTIHTGEKDAEFTQLNNKYYVVVGNEDLTITLKSKTTAVAGNLWTGFNARYYTAKVHVFKLDSTGTAWSEYTYNTNATVTMDALKSSAGLKLNLSSMTFRSTGTPNNNGDINVADNTFGKNTYFVTVSYSLAGQGLAKAETYAADVFRVLVAKDVADIDFNVTTNGSQAGVSITSGLPIASVRYFASDSAASVTPANFESLYKTATVKQSVNVGTGAMSKSLSLSDADSKYYYVEVTDISGAKSVLDVSSETAIGDDPVYGETPNLSTDTKIGEIILIALIAVFVLAIVLVIVQRIIDYKKKLY